MGGRYAEACEGVDAIRRVVRRESHQRQMRIGRGLMERLQSSGDLGPQNLPHTGRDDRT